MSADNDFLKDVEGSVTLSDSNLSLEDISIIQVTEAGAHEGEGAYNSHRMQW